MPKPFQLSPTMANAFPVLQDPGSVFQRGPGGILPERGSARQRDMVALMMQNAMQSAPQSGSPLLSFLTPMLGGAVGARTDSLYQDAQMGRDQEAIQKLVGLMGGGTGSVPLMDGGGYSTRGASVSPRPMTAGQEIARDTMAALGRRDMNPYRNAIGSIESAGSGDYSAIGPTHDRLGRALGRYQIMEANIGPWAQEAIGRSVTPDEFLANPQLQDLIFDHKFGGYIDQYGPEGAAQAWFAGPGGVGRMNRQDSLGTSVGEYTTRFNSALGATSPVQGASAGPAPYSSGYGAPGVSPEMIQLMVDPNISEPIRGLASSLVQSRMSGGGYDPMDAIDLQRAMIGLETDRVRLDQLMQPQPTPRNILRGADGYQYYEDTGERVLPNISAPERTDDAERNRQANVALQQIEERVQTEVAAGKDRDTVLWEIAQDPTGRRLLEIAGIDPNSLRPPPAPVPDADGGSGGFWSNIFGGNSGPAQPAAPSYDDPLGIR